MNGLLTIHPKVAGGGLAGALVVVIVYCLHQWAHIDLPDVVAGALVLIVGGLGGWLAPLVPGEATAK